MMNDGKATAANVVPMRPAGATTEKTRESEKKWGKNVIALGFCVVPSLLLRAQQRLGLNSNRRVLSSESSGAPVTGAS